MEESRGADSRLVRRSVLLATVVLVAASCGSDPVNLPPEATPTNPPTTHASGPTTTESENVDLAPPATYLLPPNTCPGQPGHGIPNTVGNQIVIPQDEMAWIKANCQFEQVTTTTG